LMRVCRATKRNGTPCTAPARGSNGYCWAHDPTHADKRRRAASRAGRSKPSAELRNVKAQLQALADGVLSGELDKGDAAVVSQVLNVYLRALETERKWKELTEMEERVAALEQAEGVRGWGA
jgi:hypothetical protein